MDTAVPRQQGRRMRRGALRHFRHARPWLARWLALVMVLPLLIGVLPQPSLSAAAALDHDLLWSTCSETGAPVEERDHTQRHDAQCILCAVGCPSCAPLLTADRPVPFLSTTTRRSETPAIEAGQKTVLRVLREGSPTRGPPHA